LLAEAARYLPALADAPVERITTGLRPMPKHGHPIVRTSRASLNRCLAVPHSGVTLAPILGELAATEIIDGVEIKMLAPCRQARFATG